MDKQKGLLAGGALAGLFVGAHAGKIIKGITGGVVMIVIAFGLIFYTVNGVEENSVSIDALPLQSVNEVGDTRGPVKVFGEITTDNPEGIQILRCRNRNCFGTEVVFEEENLFYRDVELQRFEVVREVEEEETSGNQAKETVTYKHEWVTRFEQDAWADMSLGGLELDPADARTIVDFDTEEIEDVFIPDLPNLETYGRNPAEDEPQFGTTRAMVRYLPVDNREYIVVGEKRSSAITSGSPYIITDKTDTELVEQLGGEETTLRWGLRFVAFLLLTFGFTSMLSPILVFTDMIPLAGDVARGIATLVSGVLSAVIVLATVFLLNFWWLVAIIGLVGVGIFVYMGSQAKQVKTT